MHKLHFWQQQNKNLCPPTQSQVLAYLFFTNLIDTITLYKQFVARHTCTAATVVKSTIAKNLTLSEIETKICENNSDKKIGGILLATTYSKYFPVAYPVAYDAL